MNSRMILRGALVLGFLLVGSSDALRAQELRFDAGLATPLSGADDYFDPGPTFSGELEYPLQDRLSILGNVNVDLLNNNDFWPVPDTRIWRYQVGLQADVLGDAVDAVGVRVFGLVGLATTESDPFVPEDFEVQFPVQPHELAENGFAGSGGVRLGFGLDNITSGWISAQVNWNSGDEERFLLLQDAANQTLDPISSVVTGSLRLGFSYSLGGGM